MGRSILNVDSNSPGQDYYTGDKELELVLKYDSVIFLVFPQFYKYIHTLY